MNMACLHLFSFKMSFVRILKFSSESSSVSIVRLLPRDSFSSCCKWYVIFDHFFSVVVAAGRGK